jgi:hypothetical protein
MLLVPLTFSASRLISNTVSKSWQSVPEANHLLVSQDNVHDTEIAEQNPSRVVVTYAHPLIAMHIVLPPEVLHAC